MATESETPTQAGSLWSDWDAEQQFSRNPWLTVSPTFLLNYSCGWAWVRQSERARHLTLQIQSHWQLLARHPGSSHPVHLKNTHSLYPCAALSHQHEINYIFQTKDCASHSLLLQAASSAKLLCGPDVELPKKTLIYTVKPSSSTKSLMLYRLCPNFHADCHALSHYINIQSEETFKWLCMCSSPNVYCWH